MPATPVSANTALHRRRISRATKGLAVASVVATAIFGLAAAHTGKAPSGSTSGGDSATGGDDAGLFPSEDDFSTPSLTPSQSAPAQSFGPPVTSSGGS